MPPMDKQTIETRENSEKQPETAKVPMFVRHMQNAKVRSGVRSGLRNAA
jgi:hypothetical protein